MNRALQRNSLRRKGHVRNPRWRYEAGHWLEVERVDGAVVEIHLRDHIARPAASICGSGQGPRVVAACLNVPVDCQTQAVLRCAGEPVVDAEQVVRNRDTPHHVKVILGKLFHPARRPSSCSRLSVIAMSSTSTRMWLLLPLIEQILEGHRRGPVQALRYFGDHV
jgi:hypothetical protein